MTETAASTETSLSIEIAMLCAAWEDAVADAETAAGAAARRSLVRGLVRAPAIPAGFAEPPAEGFDSDPLRKRETIELVGAYYRIEDPTIRRRLFELAKALAAGGERQPEK